MKKPSVFIIVLVLIGSIVRYSTSEIALSIRTIDFLRIFTIGLLSGVLLIILITKFKNRL
ncbi:MAG: hypothetical protein ABI549_12115 [Flavobacterium sp.]